MEKPTIRIHDLANDEIIDREMTEDEYAVYLENQASNEAQSKVFAEEQKAKEKAQAKLEALGLTTDDLKALGL